MASAGADAETVAAETGGEDEAGQFAGLADGGHTIRRAVDEAGPCSGYLGFAECRQKFQRPLWVSRMAAAFGFGSRIRTRSIGVGASSRQCFSVSCPPRILQSTWSQAAPALEEHRNEFACKPHLLRGRVDATEAADGERVTAVAPACYRNGFVCSASGSPSAPAVTDRIEERTAACGKRIPSWRQKDEARAPPDMMAVLVRIVPFR